MAKQNEAALEKLWDTGLIVSGCSKPEWVDFASDTLERAGLKLSLEGVPSATIEILGNIAKISFMGRPEEFADRLVEAFERANVK